MKLKKTKTKRQTTVRNLAKQFSMLELFTQALSQLYPLDRLMPGITVSYLPLSNEYYAAVCRYDIKGTPSPDNPGSKQTLLSVTAPSLREAIITLAAEWQGRTLTATKFMSTPIYAGKLAEKNITVRRRGKKVR